MSRAGIERQARRMARLPHPRERLAALDRIAAILELAVKRREAQLAVDAAVLAKSPPAELVRLQAIRDELWSSRS